jgi:hypothetical protein
MKKTIIFILAFAAILIIACNNSENDEKENPYEGAWEVTYSKWIYPDTTIETTKFVNPEVKILTEKHFAFGLQSGKNKIDGGGGEYTYDADTYTELIKYHFVSDFIGKSVVFKSKIEGEMWTLSTVYKSDSLDVDGTETWKRIE